jgi:hypothetical protein
MKTKDEQIYDLEVALSQVLENLNYKDHYVSKNLIRFTYNLVELVLTEQFKNH